MCIAYALLNTTLCASLYKHCVSVGVKESSSVWVLPQNVLSKLKRVSSLIVFGEAPEKMISECCLIRHLDTYA